MCWPHPGGAGEASFGSFVSPQGTQQDQGAHRTRVCVWQGDRHFHLLHSQGGQSSPRMHANRAAGDLSGLHYAMLERLPPDLASPTQLRKLNGDTQPYEDDDEFVTINSLVSEPDLDTSDSVLLLKMLKMKTAPRNEGGRNSFEDAPVSFKKLIFWVDLNASEGDNVLVTPVGKGQNENLFHDCLALRDSGVLGENARCSAGSRSLIAHCALPVASENTAKVPPVAAVWLRALQRCPREWARTDPPFF